MRPRETRHSSRRRITRPLAAAALAALFAILALPALRAAAACAAAEQGATLPDSARAGESERDAPALPDSVARRQLGRGEARFAGDGGVGPFALGRSFLFRGSERVSLAGRPLRAGADYTIDANRGSILFSRPVAAGDSVIVTYRYLPFELLPTYRRWLPRPTGTAPESVAAESYLPYYGKSVFETGGLRVGGSKSFALLVGSDRDLMLDQALRVSIEGALSRDVSVVARLSDQNLPFTPEGSSARLEELDKVFVEITAPKLGATLGDYEVDLSEGEFTSYRRILKGAQGRVNLDRFSASASAGVSEGRFFSIELRGSEGRQGPYDVTQEGAQTVVAGSEEVFLDGQRLTRGEDNDYVIDYGRGEIRFTSRQPIRTGSRIAVDYQATGDDFKRSFVTATARRRLGGTESRSPGSVGLTILSESDDADDPQGVLLSEEDRESLAAAGDDDPVVSGAEFVGVGGDYDTTGGRFVFVGEGEGAFEVDFSFVGTGQGEYNADLDPATGRRIYLFDLADSSGDYAPLRRLPRPARHRVFAIDAHGSPVHGLDLSVEAAHSSLDENTLSDRDDGDNGANALLARGALRERALSVGDHALGSVTISGKARRLGEHFATLSRVESIHLDERWNTAGFDRALSPEPLEEDVLSRGRDAGLAFREDLLEGELLYEPRKGVLAGIEAGSFSQRGVLESDRGAARIELQNERWGRGSARAERIRSEGEAGPGRTERLGADLSRRFGALTPTLWASREMRKSGRPDSLSGTRRDRGGVGLASTPIPSVQLGTQFVLESAQLRAGPHGSPREWYRASEQEVSASIASHGAVSVSSRYRRRDIDYTDAVPDVDATNHLGRIELRHRALDGGVSGEYDYDVTTFQAGRRQRVLVPVMEEEVGDFDSLGNFVPGEGQFRAADIERDGVPTTDLAASARLVIDPSRWLGKGVRSERGERESRSEGSGDGSGERVRDRAADDAGRNASGGGWGAFWRGLRLESLARVSEQSTTSRKARLLLLDPAEFQRDDTTVRGETLVRQEATWHSRRTGSLVSLRIGREDVEDNTIEGARREELRHSGLVRARQSLSERVTAQLDWEPSRRRQTRNGMESARLDSDFFEATGTYQPRPSVTASLAGRYGREVERRLEERLESIETSASVSTAILARGRLTARLATLRFLSDERVGGTASPLSVRRPGEEWRLSADYDLSRYLGASILYSGDNRRAGGARHLLRMEARALF